MTPTPDDSRRAMQSAYQAAWGPWFASLSPADKVRLRKAGMADALSDDLRSPVGDFDDPAEFDEASSIEHPVDLFEPGETSASEFQAAQDAFAAGLRWCAEATGLARIGRRVLALTHAVLPRAVTGARTHRGTLKSAGEAIGLENLVAVGALFGAAFAWLRRDASFSAIGRRALAMLYVLGAAGALTLQQIGAELNHSRQGSNKLVLDASDTFRGIRSRNMRGEEHRLICSNSH